MDNLYIRSVTDITDFERIEQLQRIIWGMDGDSALVPSHLLITAQHHGGIVLGAFTDTNIMVGFVFGFLGKPDPETASVLGNQVLHCSHMMGVHPDYRGKSIGYRLKVAQREVLLQQQIRLTVWTFDPLLSVNARLNIQQLGGICRRYIPNLYGEIKEALNAGLPSDRFELEWWVATERVKKRIELPHISSPSIEGWRMAGAALLNHTRSADNWRIPDGWHSADASYLLIEIPADFQRLRGENRELGLEWRLHSREIFQWVFSQGYIVTAFTHDKADNRSYYVVTHSTSLTGDTHAD